MFSLMPWKKERTDSGLLAPRTEPLVNLPEVEEWFNRFFARWPRMFGEGWPTMPEVETTDEAVLVRVDAPGFEAAEFDVSVSDNILTIRAERKVVGEGKAPRVERRLERSLTLPVAVIPEKVTAKYHSGVLEISLPRTAPVKHLKIEVKAA